MFTSRNLALNLKLQLIAENKCKQAFRFVPYNIEARTINLFNSISVTAKRDLILWLKLHQLRFQTLQLQSQDLLGLRTKLFVKELLVRLVEVSGDQQAGNYFL